MFAARTLRRTAALRRAQCSIRRFAAEAKEAKPESEMSFEEQVQKHPFALAVDLRKLYAKIMHLFRNYIKILKVLRM